MATPISSSLADTSSRLPGVDTVIMRTVINIDANVVGGYAPPQYATPYSAAFDLHAAIEDPVAIRAGQIVMVPTELQRIAIPTGYCMMLYARSGLASKYGVCLANGVGVIDSDYRGHVIAALLNSGESQYVVHPGDRIAQAMVIPVPAVKITSVTEPLPVDTQRGTGGFGSTG